MFDVTIIPMLFKAQVLGHDEPTQWRSSNSTEMCEFKKEIFTTSEIVLEVERLGFHLKIYVQTRPVPHDIRISLLSWNAPTVAY